jgi:hypothetical protein
MGALMSLPLLERLHHVFPMPLPYFTLSQGLPDSQDIPDARNVKRSGSESMP